MYYVGGLNYSYLRIVQARGASAFKANCQQFTLALFVVHVFKNLIIDREHTLVRKNGQHRGNLGCGQGSN